MKMFAPTMAPTISRTFRRRATSSRASKIKSGKRAPAVKARVHPTEVSPPPVRTVVMSSHATSIRAVA